MVPVIAIIPSRGGSKRIPMKSLELLGNQSLIARTIHLAQNADIFSRILVSTDSREIADEAIKSGAEVLNLRDEYFDDYSPVSLATIHTLRSVIQMENSLAKSTVVQLMPNCPFLSLETLLNCIDSQKNSSEQSLISCVRVDPINWYAFTLANHEPRWIADGIDLTARTQDNPPLFVPTGSVWIATASYLIENQSFYGKKYRFHEISQLDGYDIDTVEQLNLARIIYRGKIGNIQGAKD